MAFHDLGAGRSGSLLESDYGHVLAGVGSNPAASLAGVGQVVRYLGRNRAVVRTPHGLMLETSTVPLRVPTSLRSEAAVDLGLVRRGGAYMPVQPLAALSIASDSHGGVSVGDDGLRIAMAGAESKGSQLGAESSSPMLASKSWTMP